MFELDGALLLPDRRPVTLREIAGSRGLVAVGSGAAANAAFRWFIAFMTSGSSSRRQASISCSSIRGSRPGM